MTIEKTVTALNARNDMSILDTLVAQIMLFRSIPGYRKEAEILYLNNVFEGVKFVFVNKQGMSVELATALVESHRKIVADKLEKIENS
jgi:hypothetical protein